jgi:DNA-binding NtrC family response regulator
VHKTGHVSRYPLKSENGATFTILIADRNPNVREFLRREMMAEGYRVRLAKNGREVLRWIYHYEPLDLVILDLDLPDASDAPLLEKLNDRIPTLPVVVHTFSTDYVASNGNSLPVVFVEKEGNSIENLKKVVADMLLKTHPYRTQDRAMDEAGSVHP